MYNNDIKDRSIIFADYIIENNATIRNCAKHFGIAKSTVHYDLKYRLPKIKLTKYLIVKEILDKNFQEKHLRGGEATRIRYLEKNQKEL